MATWKDMAESTKSDAQYLDSEKMYRSAVSRYYYSAFFKITSELQQRNAQIDFAAGRDTPSHAQIGMLINKYITNFGDQRRSNLIRQIASLYRLRIRLLGSANRS